MAKKIRRVIGSLLILSAILITQLPVPEIFASGANDFQIDKKTLIKYTGTASTVSVPDSIKKIGEEAFAGNLGVNTVTCGTNTKEIAHGAFSNCTYLTKVEIPDSVEIIDKAAFSGCENLSHINFGKNVKAIEHGAFAGCNKVKKVVIDEKNPYLVYDKGALYNKDKTILYAYFGHNEENTYTMPNTVEKVHRYAFWGNHDLEHITLSSALKEIAGYTFSNCKNLQDIEIPFSVHTIDAKAFENCISLKDTTIPGSVTYIDETAFDGCNRLNVIADEGTLGATLKNKEKKSDIQVAEEEDTKKVVVSSQSENKEDREEQNDEKTVIEETTTTSERTDDEDVIVVGSRNTQKKNTSGLKNASEDPSNVEYMPSKDPLSGIEDSSVIAKTIVVDGNAVLFLDPKVNLSNGKVVKEDNSISDGTETDTDTDTGIEDSGVIIYDPQKGGYLPKYKVVNNSIAAQAFYADRKMEDVSIDNGIQRIGDFSFARSNMKKAVIPDTVTEIGYGAFYYCDKLEEVSIPQSVTNIEAHAFEHSMWLEHWNSNADSSDFQIVGDHILLAYKGSDNNIEIPEGVKRIAPGCFENHKEINSVFFPDSLKVVGEDAFRGCSSLTMITGGNYIETIDDRAFMNCPITTITIPSTVKEIGLRAIDFTNCGKPDDSKVVMFNGTVLPKVVAKDTSMRLDNEDYRKDALFNVLFAIVPDAVTELEDTVLDNEKLGFSGLVLTIEKDSDGNETGNLLVKENYLFSDKVLEALPHSVNIKGKHYEIKDFDSIKLDEPISSSEKKREVHTLLNGKELESIKAEFSENELVGTLSINEDDTVLQQIAGAYAELFGGQTPTMKGYQITLTDKTGTVPIKKFGKAQLTISMSLPEGISGETYHVVGMDEDGQLEEVNTIVDKENKQISFTLSHLSPYAIYATGLESQTLNVKNGKLVKNFKKDVSPNTGDRSIPVHYVLAIALLCLGLIVFFYKTGTVKRVKA